MNKKIPVTVIVTTKNEARNIAACLSALKRFDEVLVVDSASSDKTTEIATAHGATVIDFRWNGRYPKKRQWCLDNLPLKYDWVFFVDADEIVTKELADEIESLELSENSPVAGYFVRGLYVYEGHALRHGIANNKLCLLNRRRMMFPVVDDLDIPGMGEIEGHYQPVETPTAPATDSRQKTIGCLHEHILHHADIDGAGWTARHERYAHWESLMNARGAWPEDPVAHRRVMKRFFKAFPAWQAVLAFTHSFVLKRGFLDGRHGFILARSRWRYYRMIAHAAAQNSRHE
jgi:glycosyltransferase involved in cell wall biosynthesis